MGTSTLRLSASAAAARLGVSVKALRRYERHGLVAPERTPLKFEYANGRASVTIPRVNGHAMVVLE